MNLNVNPSLHDWGSIGFETNSTLNLTIDHGPFYVVKVGKKPSIKVNWCYVCIIPYVCIIQQTLTKNLSTKNTIDWESIRMASVTAFQFSDRFPIDHDPIMLPSTTNTDKKSKYKKYNRLRIDSDGLCYSFPIFWSILNRSWFDYVPFHNKHWQKI